MFEGIVCYVERRVLACAYVYMYIYLCMAKCFAALLQISIAFVAQKNQIISFMAFVWSIRFDLLHSGAHFYHTYAFLYK